MSVYTHLNRKLQKLLFAKKSRYDLSELQALYEGLHLKKYPIIHIAGTNGKGSCAQKISAALTTSGYRCGRYTSPHVATFRERITIDNKMISKAEVEKYLPELLVLKHGLTFFEVTTLLALLYFSEMEVDVAVVEVGLGGRLDATNCIAPLLTIITSISYDHQAILGDTLEEIAYEKGGIIKKEVPVVLGPTCTQKSLKKWIKEKKAPEIRVCGEFLTYDLENQAISRAALEELKKHFKLQHEKVEDALLQKPPCRYEKVSVDSHEVLLDISHNGAGLKALFNQAKFEHPDQKIVVFFAIAFNHDFKQAAEILKASADEVILLDSEHPRLCKVEELKVHFPTAPIVKDEEALKKLKSLGKDSLYIFTGSIFIMEKVRRLLGLDCEGDHYPLFDGSTNFSESKEDSELAQSD